LHVLVLLRSLVPFRKLSHAEALFLAEQQAAVLLKLVHVFEPPVQVEQIALDVGIVGAILDDPEQEKPGRSIFGQTDDSWVITLNSPERAGDRNFVIAHEIKHILDHGFGEVLYRPVDVMTTEDRQEHAATYFASCLTMPRPWLELLWERHVRSAGELSGLFGTAHDCMRFRLEVLGLLDEPEPEPAGMAEVGR
jgi:hypothetical protein